MNLAIDIGNTLVKIGSFVKSDLSSPVLSLPSQDLDRKVRELNPKKVIVSSVAFNLNHREFPFMEDFSTMVLSNKTPLPFSLDYETPETLGVDRIAGAAGAQVINPEGNSLIIDAGTCITYDLMEDGSYFRGGIISPGIQLRYNSMKDYTGNLPLINHSFDNDVPGFIGKSTRGAMESGVINGIISEMDSFIDRYTELFPDLKVIMCGGEAKFFESRLKASIFAVPELVLVGLNRILEYNV